jgi:hypothetical protein
MRAANLANEAVRQADVGHVWEEVLSGSGALNTFTLHPFQTFRVRAGGAVLVTIDGTLAMTMQNNEIAIFNAGSGVPGAVPGDARYIPPVVVIAGTAFMQVARDNIRNN